MTIETAVPNSAETLAALFDTLVDAVAKRVTAHVDALIDAKLEAWASEQMEGKLDAWAMTSGILEDRVTDMVQSFVDNQLDLDALVEKSLDNMDLDDLVATAAQNLTFEVTVSQ